MEEEGCCWLALVTRLPDDAGTGIFAASTRGCRDARGGGACWGTGWLALGLPGPLPFGSGFLMYRSILSCAAGIIDWHRHDRQPVATCDAGSGDAGECVYLFVCVSQAARETATCVLCCVVSRPDAEGRVDRGLLSCFWPRLLGWRRRFDEGLWLGPRAGAGKTHGGKTHGWGGHARAAVGVGWAGT